MQFVNEVLIKINVFKMYITVILGWKSNDISVQIKLLLVRGLVYPVFLYISKCRGLKNAHIDAFEIHFWKRILRVSWTLRRTIESIFNEVDIKKKLRTLVIGRVEGPTG